MMGVQPTPHIDKVMNSLRREGKCVICTRTPNAKGYPKITTSGETKYAHRVVWEHHNGPIPDGMCVLHECDNPPCVRIEHLHLGTKAVNNEEMVARGRHWSQKAGAKCRNGHEYPKGSVPGNRHCQECRKTYREIYNERRRKK